MIRALDHAPVIMGHSFGGLVAELLLDRGLGIAGVAISPAPVKGVLRLPPAELPSGFPSYGFTNTMAEGEAKAAYDRYQVPGPGRVIFQAAFANLNPRAVAKVDFHKDDRPPLLIIGNDNDHTAPASVSKEAAQRLGKSKAVFGYGEFAGRPHFTAGAPGWEKVADYALHWANRHAGTSAERQARATA